jgi:hypothetical protein
VIDSYATKSNESLHTFAHVIAIYNVHLSVVAVIVLDCAGVVSGLLIVIVGATLSIIVTSTLQLHVLPAASFTYHVYVQFFVTVNV